MNWRLLMDGPQDAAMNMAVDEAILIEHGRGNTPPTLRFYFWNIPTVSIGYFQDLEREIDVEACRRAGAGLIRRPTGGRAVLHHREVTYSVVMGGAAQGILPTYQWISKGLARGLELLGMTVERHRPRPDESGVAEKLTGSAACFDSPSWYEITVGGKKIIGSAQVRREDVLLQHGSILLETQADELFELLKFDSGELRARMKAVFPRRATGIREAMGRDVTADEVIQAMRRGFEEGLDVALTQGRLTEDEVRLAHELVQEKYGDPEWNRQRGRHI